MVVGSQIFGVLFGTFMIYLTFIRGKRKEFTAKESLFWLGLWFVFSIIAIFPSILDPLLKPIGFLRALDLLTIVGFLFLIATNFYTYALVRKIQRKLEAIVRDIAFKKNKGK
mgnify:CR=1 FL=1